MLEFLKKLIGVLPSKPSKAPLARSPKSNMKSWKNLDAKAGIELLANELANFPNQAVLFGAVAMGVYGYERNTMDIDFMLPESDFDNFSRLLAKIGYTKVLQTEQYAKFQHENRELLDIDTVFISDETAQKVIATAKTQTVWNASFLCAALETIISTKLHAITYNNKRRGGKDLVDLQELIKCNNIKTNEKWFKELCLKYSNEDIYKKILME